MKYLFLSLALFGCTTVVEAAPDYVERHDEAVFDQPAAGTYRLGVIR